MSDVTVIPPPPPTVPIGRTSDGRVVLIDSVWARYLTDAVWRRLGGFNAGSLDQLENEIEALAVLVSALEGDMGAAQADIVALEAAVAAIVAPDVVSVTLDFGASFTDKAQTVVTGQTWVSLSSVITPTVMCPLGIDTDEIRLLDMRPVISDLVAGVGFTVTLYSEPEARGTYTVSCVGV